MDLADVAARLDAGESLPATVLDDVGWRQDRFGAGILGLVWDTFALDRVTAHLEPDERHQQPFGIVHGGVWCSVVESVASFGASLRAVAVGELVVGVSNTTDFLRPHTTGRIDVAAHPVHVGRTQQLWQVVLARSVDAKPVARGQVRLQQVAAERFVS